MTLEGFEPSHLLASPPQDDVSTNSTIRSFFPLRFTKLFPVFDSVETIVGIATTVWSTIVTQSSGVVKCSPL